MFDGADSIKSLDLSNWMTNNVTDFGRMFANTTSLEHLNISNWDVSKASSTQFMFMNATAITELDINAWKLDSVNSTHKMFSNASSITHLDLSNWELSKANDVSNMFEKMTSLQSLDLRSWNLVDSRANTYYVFKETPVKKLILGDKTIFNKDPELPDPTNNNQYTGRWIKEGTHTPIYNDSNEFLTEYDGVQSGTYIWQQKYEIEFVIGDKVVHENIASYVAGVGAPKLLPAFKKGSHFIGWFDLNGNIVTSISPLSTGKIVLTARFMDEMYEINYDLSGGINDDRNPSSFSFGLGVDRLYPATKEGYTFIGWFDEHDQLVSHISKDVSSNVNLFAKFVANEYGVVYELDGGVNHIQNPKTFIYGVGVEKLYPASKIGHTFIGWFDEMGTRIHNISLTVHKDITLFARFEVNEYEIIYNLEGGFNDSRNPHTYLFGEGVKKLFSPIRESYVFKGWYDENDKKVDKIDGDEQKVIILTARWEKEIKDVVSSNTPPTGINNETTLLISIVIIATLYLTYSFKIKNNNKDKSSH